MTARLVVLVSGSGTNLAAILDACADGRLDAEVVKVVSNRAGVRALDRAADCGVGAMIMESEPGESRPDYDRRLAAAIGPLEPDLVVLAGWMRLLASEFCGQFRVVNLHPALPGAFPGLDAIGRAFTAWQEGDITESGVMVHLVPDDGVDSGPVVASESLTFEAGESLESFERRMHELEHRLIVDAVGTLTQEAFL